MTRGAETIGADETLQAAALAMRSHGVGALPVRESDDRLVGMLTDRDIAIRAVAEGKGAETPVAEVMTREIHYVFEDDDLDAAADKMSELKVRRLPVLSREKRLVGVLSLGDISKSDDPQHGVTALEGVSVPGGPHN